MIKKYLFNGYGITFNSAGSWRFDKNIAGNVIFFVADNSSSCHADNHKNKFLILGERPTCGINESFG